MKNTFAKVKFKKPIKYKKIILKKVISVTIVITFSLIFQDHSFAETKYTQPVQLDPIFEFIDWLIFMIRLVGSVIIGLISTVAGYKWGTDLSGSGQTEAKKILKNGAVGLFWIWAGTTITSIFVNQLEKLIS